MTIEKTKVFDAYDYYINYARKTEGEDLGVIGYWLNIDSYMHEDEPLFTITRIKNTDILMIPLDTELIDVTSGWVYKMGDGRITPEFISNPASAYTWYGLNE